MTPAILLIVFLASALIACLSAGVEVALLAVNRRTLEEKLRDEGKDDHEVFRLVSDTQRALAVALIGTTASTVIGGVCLYVFIDRLIH